MSYELRHDTNQIPQKHRIPVASGSALTYQEIAKIKVEEDYERTRLNQFTIRELQVLECWDKPDAKPTDLKAPVHPLFEWRKFNPSNLQIGGSIQGLCDIRNPVVMNALEPCLRLASSFLMNIHNLTLVNIHITTGILVLMRIGLALSLTGYGKFYQTPK